MHFPWCVRYAAMLQSGCDSRPKNASHNCAKANQCVVCCRTVAVCADVPLVPENFFIVVDTGYLTCGSGKPA
jgi:hypothetical protein